MKNVFVYGTLKSGFYNNCILKDFEFKKARIYGFELYGKNRSYPFIKRGNGIVHGEIYFNISSEVIEQLDHLEGHPTFYKRVETNVMTVDEDYYVAYVYTNKDLCKPEEYIESGTWRRK